MRRFHRPDLPAVAAAQFLDALLFMVDQVLCKVDRASMAHGVEVRVPFLDAELVALAFQIPLALHYRRGERKALLKRIAAQYLPGQVVTPRKKGFSSPLGSWIDPGFLAWSGKLLDTGYLVGTGMLRNDWRERLAASDNPQWVNDRASWLLLTAELWARRWLEPTPATPEFAP